MDFCQINKPQISIPGNLSQVRDSTKMKALRSEQIVFPASAYLAKIASLKACVQI